MGVANSTPQMVEEHRMLMKEQMENSNPSSQQSSMGQGDFTRKDALSPLSRKSSLESNHSSDSNFSRKSSLDSKDSEPQFVMEMPKSQDFSPKPINNNNKSLSSYRFPATDDSQPASPVRKRSQSMHAVKRTSPIMIKPRSMFDVSPTGPLSSPSFNNHQPLSSSPIVRNPSYSDFQGIDVELDSEGTLDDYTFPSPQSSNQHSPTHLSPSSRQSPPPLRPSTPLSDPKRSQRLTPLNARGSPRGSPRQSPLSSPVGSPRVNSFYGPSSPKSFKSVKGKSPSVTLTPLKNNNLKSALKNANHRTRSASIATPMKRSDLGFVSNHHSMKRPSFLRGALAQLHPHSMPKNSPLKKKLSPTQPKTPLQQFRGRTRSRRSASICEIRHKVSETNEVSRGVDSEGRKTVNQYAVVKLVGTGAHSKVKLCVNVNTGRKYAVKIMNKSLNRSIRRSGMAHNSYERIRKEVAILKKLNHKNIVKVFEVIDDPLDGKMYIIFEYIDGGQLVDLDKEGTSNRIIPEDTALRYFRDLINGVDYLHKNKILHRDIKPENLLIEQKSDTLMLSDFGVSQLFEGDDDTLADTQGTPAFQSPESCESGQTVKGRPADIWACGITLYIMLFGSVPFKGDGIGFGNLVSLYNKIKKAEFEIPEDGISDDLRDFLTRILHKDPSKRLTIQQIKHHPWFLHGQQYAQTPPHSLDAIPKISSEDIENSIQVQDNFTLLDKVFWKMKRLKNKFSSGGSPSSPVGSPRPQSGFRRFLPSLTVPSHPGSPLSPKNLEL